MRRALGKEPGVAKVDVDLATHQVKISFDAALTGPARLAAAMEEAGYPSTPLA